MTSGEEIAEGWVLERRVNVSRRGAFVKSRVCGGGEEKEHKGRRQRGWKARLEKIL